MGLAGQGVILGGGAPQFAPQFAQFPQLGGQGASVWGQGGQSQLVELMNGQQLLQGLPGQQLLWTGQGAGAPGLPRN